MIDDVCICIPTYRPEITVLKDLVLPEDMPIFIISDPKTFPLHRHQFAGQPNVFVTEGAEGMSAQVAACYRVSAAQNFPWFFKLDDDMGPKTFLHKDGRIPSLEEVIRESLACAEETKTTLVGVSNTMNRYWMNDGYGRTYGLIHGGAHLCRSSMEPEKFIDTRIAYYEDVYRSLSHRRQDGAVGRVKHIGIDKSGSTDRVEEAADKHKADIALILETFPGMVTCEGLKEIQGGRFIANWRYKKTPKSGATKGPREN